MYERFTDRARKVMQLANQEAMRHEQDYIGSEHILLGLIREGSGVGANALKNLDVHLGKLRSYVERLLQESPVSLGLGAQPPQGRGKKVLERAMMEARNMGHNYVGTEHILLGLMEDHEGIAGRALDEQGLTTDDVRHEIFSLLGHGIRPIPAPAERLMDAEDLPETLKAQVAELDAEIRRFTREKEEAVANQDFRKAAALRDEADRSNRERRRLTREWFASRVAEGAWLIANDSAAQRLAQKIQEAKAWDLLPDLAAALELAGCNDAEIINHCYSGAKHSSKCWVVELLLSAPPAEP